MNTTACLALALLGWIGHPALILPTAAMASGDEGRAQGHMLKPKSPFSKEQRPLQGPSGMMPQRAGPDPKQLLEERLRHGQMEEPTAQGAVSDRLDRFYQTQESLVGGRDHFSAAEEPRR